MTPIRSNLMVSLVSGFTGASRARFLGGTGVKKSQPHEIVEKSPLRSGSSFFAQTKHVLYLTIHKSCGILNPSTILGGKVVIPQLPLEKFSFGTSGTSVCCTNKSAARHGEVPFLPRSQAAFRAALRPW